MVKIGLVPVIYRALAPAERKKSGIFAAILQCIFSCMMLFVYTHYSIAKLTVGMVAKAEPTRYRCRQALILCNKSKEGSDIYSSN